MNGKEGQMKRKMGINVMFLLKVTWNVMPIYSTSRLKVSNDLQGIVIRSR